MSYPNYNNYNQYIKCCKPIGAQGAQGDQGATGPIGPIGSQGAQGPQGAQGVAGRQGPQGAQGAVGAVGAQGVAGRQGPQGAQGAVGAVGAVGAQGAQGAVGAQGAQGAQGVTSSQSLQFTIALEQSGVSTSFNIAGVDDVVAPPGTTDTFYNIPFGAYNNHVFIDISSAIRDVSSADIDITINGTSISESSAVPVVDSETISIPSSISIPNGFQSLKKWLYVSDISFSNVSSINYDIENLGYIDFLNTDVRIIGYRAEILGDANSDGADITLLLRKVDNGASIFTDIIDLENITVNDPLNQIVDNLRTGVGVDRSYTMPIGTSLWPPGINLAGTDFVLKQTDFDTYFVGGENIILGSGNEGLIIKVESTDLGAPNGPQYISLIVYYEPL